MNSEREAARLLRRLKDSIQGSMIGSMRDDCMRNLERLEDILKFHLELHDYVRGQLEKEPEDRHEFDCLIPKGTTVMLVGDFRSKFTAEAFLVDRYPLFASDGKKLNETRQYLADELDKLPWGTTHVVYWDE